MAAEHRRPWSLRAGALVTTAIVGLAIGTGALWLRGSSLAPPSGGVAATVDAAASPPPSFATAGDATSEPAATVAREALVPRGRIAVRVVDENGRPIADARAIVASLPQRWPGTTMESHESAATTDGDGRAVVDAVPQGSWFVRAEHERYLFSPFQQSSRAPVEVGPQPIAATVVLVEPFVAGIAVRGAEILASRFTEPRGSWGYVDDCEVEPMRQRLALRWPGAVFSVWARQLDRPVPAPGSTDVELVIGGRTPWVGRAPVVRLGEFFGPMRLDAAQLTRSDEFGRVALRILDASGAPCAGVVAGLRQQGGNGAQFSLAAGAERAVPAGVHVPVCTQPFVVKLLPPWVVVGRGTTTTIDLQGRLLSRTEIAVEGPESAARAQLRHSLLRDDVALELHDGKGRGEYWIPEGTLVVTWFGRERGVGLGDPGSKSLLGELSPLARSGEIAIGGGTAAAPQRLVVRPQ